MFQSFTTPYTAAKGSSIKGERERESFEIPFSETMAIQTTDAETPRRL